ncbi:zinc finger and BTB domain-containing protein 44-like [Macrobrachium rosenbergii]|uniref:zinc finger and BTB domain-containing protein 44-like n=1 Tax=Macrobrachium rosenbergii TaxID=79674 RepID=UPI0034D48CD2
MSGDKPPPTSSPSTTPAAPSPVTSGGGRPPPPLCPILQEGEDYDAWVLAGGRLFRAHGSVLASHSAYLRACVAGTCDGDTRVLLPHVPPAGFAAVLAYMYTGRLPLTPATLYEVLVAGHLLQMPPVVSLCQALLTTTTASTAAIATSATSLDIPEVPPALSMWRGLARLVPPHQQATSASSSSLPVTIIRPTPTRPCPTHLQINPPQDSNREENLDESSNGTLDDQSTRKQAENVGRISKYSADDNEPLSERVHAGAVIIDIATCDGPVFFERVINRAYKANPLASHDDSETDTEINVEEVDSCDDAVGAMSENTQPRAGALRGNELAKCSLANSLRLAASGMAKGNMGTTSPPTPNNHAGRTYHCVYCNHTFKSHYCYQKHMRRHINPITVEIDKLRGSSAPSPGSTDMVHEQDGRDCWGESSRGGSTFSIPNGRSRSTSPYSSKSLSPAPSGGLKILDLNVQYFPCKTCGSKFPSYYFVHKHRRLCHQDEETSSVSEKSSRQSTPKSLPASQTPTPTTTSTI